MNGEQVLEKLKNVLVDVFNITSEQVDLNTGRDDIIEWDSLGHLRLFLEIEQVFNVNFSIDEISELNKIESIIDNIINKSKSDIKGG